MKKSEIEQGIKRILKTIKTANGNMNKYLQPYEEIKEHLNIIQSIEKENRIETGLDYEIVLDDTFRSCITKVEDTKNAEKIEIMFKELLDNLRLWKYEVSENESEQISHYIDTLTEIKDYFNPNTIEEFQSQLLETIKRLEDIKICLK